MPLCTFFEICAHVRARNSPEPVTSLMVGGLQGAALSLMASIGMTDAKWQKIQKELKEVAPGVMLPSYDQLEAIGKTIRGILVYADAHLPSFFASACRQLSKKTQIYTCNTYARAVVMGASALVMIITTVCEFPNDRVWGWMVRNFPAESYGVAKGANALIETPYLGFLDNATKSVVMQSTLSTGPPSASGSGWTCSTIRMLML